MQSTWDHVAPSEYKGVSPANAPEHVQDAAAQNCMIQKVQATGQQQGPT